MTPKCASTTSNTVWSTSALWMPTRGNQRSLLFRGGGQAHTRAHQSHKKIRIHRDLTPSKIQINRVFSQGAGTFIVIESTLLETPCRPIPHQQELMKQSLCFRNLQKN